MSESFWSHSKVGPSWSNHWTINGYGSHEFWVKMIKKNSLLINHFTNHVITTGTLDQLAIKLYTWTLEPNLKKLKKPSWFINHATNHRKGFLGQSSCSWWDLLLQGSIILVFQSPSFSHTVWRIQIWLGWLFDAMMEVLPSTRMPPQCQRLLHRWLLLPLPHDPWPVGGSCKSSGSTPVAAESKFLHTSESQDCLNKQNHRNSNIWIWYGKMLSKMYNLKVTCSIRFLLNQLHYLGKSPLYDKSTLPMLTKFSPGYPKRTWCPGRFLYVKRPGPNYKEGTDGNSV